MASVVGTFAGGRLTHDAAQAIKHADKQKLRRCRCAYIVCVIGIDGYQHESVRRPSSYRNIYIRRRSKTLPRRIVCIGYP